MRSNHRPFLLKEFLFLAVIIGVAVVISYASGRTMVLTQPLSILLSPLQSVTNTWTGGVEKVQSLRDLEVENAKLKAHITELEAQLLARDEQASENNRLHDLLKLPLPEEAKPITVGRVIARNPDNWHQRLVLDKGTTSGIVTDSVIAEKKGLIGKVMATGPNVALVSLLTDPSTSVGVLNTRTRSSGVVQGQGDSWPMLRYMEQPEKWRVGDHLITSGLGGVYPKGLPVGRIVKLKSDADTLLPELRVEPTVALDHLEEVIVLPPRLTAMPTPAPKPTPQPTPTPADKAGKKPQ
jgi:rod shape-determining protein MreC